MARLGTGRQLKPTQECQSQGQGSVPVGCPQHLAPKLVSLLR